MEAIFVGVGRLLLRCVKLETGFALLCFNAGISFPLNREKPKKLNSIKIGGPLAQQQQHTTHARTAISDRQTDRPDT